MLPIRNLIVKHLHVKTKLNKNHKCDKIFVGAWVSSRPSDIVLNTFIIDILFSHVIPTFDHKVGTAPWLSGGTTRRAPESLHVIFFYLSIYLFNCSNTLLDHFFRPFPLKPSRPAPPPLLPPRLSLPQHEWALSSEHLASPPSFRGSKAAIEMCRCTGCGRPKRIRHTGLLIPQQLYCIFVPPNDVLECLPEAPSEANTVKCEKAGELFLSPTLSPFPFSSVCIVTACVASFTRQSRIFKESHYLDLGNRERGGRAFMICMSRITRMDLHRHAKSNLSSIFSVKKQNKQTQPTKKIK